MSSENCDKCYARSSPGSPIQDRSLIKPCNICRDLILTITVPAPSEPTDSATPLGVYRTRMRRAPFVEKEHIMHHFSTCIADVAGAPDLCKVCHHWFRQILAGNLEHLGIRDDPIDPIVKLWIELGTYQEIRFRNHCQGCQCVASMMFHTGLDVDPEWKVGILLIRPIFWNGPARCTLQASGKHSEFDFYLTKDAATLLPKPMIDWDTVLARLRFPRLNPAHSSEVSSVSSWSLPPSPSSSTEDTPLNPGSNESSFSNIGDDPLKVRPNGMPSGFRLIDVSRFCVVEVRRDVDYAALSYVWGAASQELTATTQKIEELKQPGRLRANDVPQLVKDAMKVCEAIDVSFLWIDRLCIVQDDHVAKKRQLNAMGRIYQSAFVTLVSLERDGVIRGLPGVSYPRQPQPSLQIGPMTAVPVIEEAETVPDNSAWATRGWTYQVGLLSQRLLVFGEKMLYFFKMVRGIPHSVRRRKPDGILGSEVQSVYCSSSGKRSDIAPEM